MTRGRQPLIALCEAGQIARKRGEVRHFTHEPGMICNFVIYDPGYTSHVRIKRVTRLRCPHTVIEREAADALAILRSIAPGPGLSRELWVYLPRGSFRFFRVEDAGLVELCRDGSVMPEKIVPLTGIQPARGGQYPPTPSRASLPESSVGKAPRGDCPVPPLPCSCSDEEVLPEKGRDE